METVALEPIDSLTITTLVDNLTDALLVDTGPAHRAMFGSTAEAAPFMAGGGTFDALRAEHGFSALVSVERGGRTHRVLFDTGMTPDGMVENMRRLEVRPDEIETIVLSHGHFDHTGGLAGLAGRHPLPMTVHPLVWTRRRLALPGAEAVELPTLSRRALEAGGFEVVERRLPSLLVDGCVLITGEVDRTTDFERGMPPSHQAWDDDLPGGGGWRHDPLVLDDQALVVHVRGRGLVVLTGCGHAGAINIVRHAMRLTGVDRLHALLGGLHLGGADFEPLVAPTVQALTELRPQLLATSHCTGWRAQQALATALPEAFVPGSSGTRFAVAAA
jgi:7,8-dihydropterin-6-yl-methyl-4-(beta-D-ribofuranosyl)aminobenzene 5'-phosphate synthase